MTTTTPARNTTQPPPAALPHEPRPPPHEIHALAHALYGHITLTHPWAAPMTPFTGFDAALPGHWETPGFPTRPTW